MERIEKQMQFILEIDKEKQIKRKTLQSNGKDFEDDAQHAWHMAIMTLLLSEYANEKIDVLKTISMLLIHDLVEIDAGDTYAYDSQGLKTQSTREAMAANRIFNLLPEDQAKKVFDLWNEFEERKTPEAKFARVMDNFQPVMLNAATDGRMWAENGVHLEKKKHMRVVKCCGSICMSISFCQMLRREELKSNSSFFEHTTVQSKVVVIN